MNSAQKGWVTRKRETAVLIETWERLKNIHHMGQTGWYTMDKSDERAIKLLKELLKNKSPK